MTPDPFDTAALRRRVLTAWSDSPVRFREDANAEEDLVTGGYRDRLVVELAQNAADAAARAGRPGELLLRLTATDGAAGLPDGPGGHGRPVLVAANTGAPLDAAGVQALATLRASAKRDAATVGRFGVGFAAVLAVSDEPVVMSRAGGVRFSAADTRELVREAGDGVPELAEELTRRDGHVPVLRLPFPAEAAVPEGYDTAVVLPLRDAAAADLTERLLAEVDDGLLLALPGLARIRVEVEAGGQLQARVLDDVGSRWRVLRREGEFPAALLAALPTEERARTRWQVTWALPAEDADDPTAALAGQPARGVPPVLHAPTPCDEPLPWPAVLVATLPLEPSRRHVVPGPVTDAVLRAAAGAYVELLAGRAAAGQAAWPLVVTGLPAGAVDGVLRAEVERLLPAAPVLVAVEDGSPVRPRDAVTVLGPAGADDAVLAALAPRLAGLVAAPRPARAVLRRLGVRELELADIVEALPEDQPGHPEPRRWHDLYTALAPLAVDPLVREALARLPVPLAGGGTARGARGVVLAGDADPAVAAALARLGARVADPLAAHPLLELLGAAVAGPRALLELDVVRLAVARSPDEPDEPDLVDEPGGPGLVDAVLTLVHAATAAGELSAGDLPWLADLALPDEDGELAPAGELALPGSPAARWFDPEEIGLLDGAVLERWGEPTLAALGVLRGPAPLRAVDVPVDPADADPLDPADAGMASPADVLEGWADWCDYVLAQLDGEARAVVPELLAVRDLDAVAVEALPEVVAAIAADAVLRPALTGRCRVVVGYPPGGAGPRGAALAMIGAARDVVPYTAWWLRDRLARLDGPAGAAAAVAPGGCGVVAAPDARDGLADLLPQAAGWLAALDPQVRSALGVIGALDDVDAAAAPAVFDCLTDPGADVAADLLLAVTGRFARLAAGGMRWPAPPPRIRGLDLASGATLVADADDVVVLDAPMYLQRRDLGVVLPGLAELAGDLAELFDLPLASDLAAGRVDEAGGVLQPTPDAARRVLPQGTPTWCEHDDLRVDGHPVDWWVDGHGGVHAATVAGLARALSWRARGWELRGTVEQVLADPGLASSAVVESAF